MPEPLNPNFCCGCRWWNYRCTIPDGEDCGNMTKNGDFVRTAHGSAEASAAALFAESEKERKQKYMEIKELEFIAEGLKTYGKHFKSTLSAFCEALSAFPKEDWQGILFSSKDEAGEYIVKEPRIDGSDLVANMTRDGQACEVRMAAYPSACAELARSVVEELRAREIRREEAKMKEFRSAWRKEQIGKAEDRKIEKEL